MTDALPLPFAKMDKIDHPPHYAAGGIEAIDVIEAFGLNFRLGNVLKYILRADRKGEAPVEDLRKAAWYLAWEIGARGVEAPTCDAIVKMGGEIVGRCGLRRDHKGSCLPTPGS